MCHRRATIRSFEICVAMSRFLASLQNTFISSRKCRRTVLCFVHGGGASVTGVICQLEGRVIPTSDIATVRSLQNEVSIFERRAKHLNFNATLRAQRAAVASLVVSLNKERYCCYALSRSGVIIFAEEPHEERLGIKISYQSFRRSLSSYVINH